MGLGDRSSFKLSTKGAKPILNKITIVSGISLILFSLIFVNPQINQAFADLGETTTINGGATFTTSTSVTVTITCPPVFILVATCDVELSNTGAFTGTYILGVATGSSLAHTLTAGDGLKTVTVRYRDIISPTGISPHDDSDTITLDGTPPSMVASLEAGANGLGWHNTATAGADVDVNYVCSDPGGSGPDGTSFTTPEVQAADYHTRSASCRY